MNRIICFTLLVVLSAQTVLSKASLSAFPSQPNTPADDSTLRSNIGFIINSETGEAVCKFHRRQSPQSFPAMSAPEFENSQELYQVKDNFNFIADCNQSQLEYSQSLARQSEVQELKVAAFPALAVGALCTIAFVDGLIFTIPDENGGIRNLGFTSSVGLQGMVYVAYKKIRKQVDNAVVLAGLKSIVKINFFCSAAGIGAGVGLHTLFYYSTREE